MRAWGSSKNDRLEISWQIEIRLGMRLENADNIRVVASDDTGRYWLVRVETPGAQATSKDWLPTI